MKRVLLISWYFPPLRSMASMRAGKWAKYLPANGYYPVVVTADKSFSEELDLPQEMPCGEVHEIPYFNPLRAIRKQSPPGISNEKKGDERGEVSPLREAILRAGRRMAAPLESRGCLNVPARLPGFYELWAIRGARAAEAILQRYGSEVVAMISSSGPPASHILAWMLKRRHPEIRWIADYRDLWVDNHIYKGLFPFSLLESALENRILALADAVTTVSEGLAGTLRPRCGDKIRVIENGFDDGDLETASPAPTTETGFAVVCAGTIYPQYHDPSPILAALRDLARDEPGGNREIVVRFLVTNTPGYDYLRSLVGSIGLEKLVRVDRSLPHRESIAIQKGADALLLLERGSEGLSDQGVLTGKVFEYLGIGKPVLAVGVDPGSELGRLLTASGLGILPGNDVDRIRTALRNMVAAKGEGRLQEMARPNREMIYRYSRKAQTARLAGILDSLVGKP